MPNGTYRRAGCGLLAAAVLVCVVGMVYYRVTYQTVAWWRPPQRMTYCGGRHYGLQEHHRRLERDGRLTHAFTVYPMGWPVYQETWDSTAHPEHVCPVVLEVDRHGSGADLYTLFGGP